MSDLLSWQVGPRFSSSPKSEESVCTPDHIVVRWRWVEVVGGRLLDDVDGGRSTSHQIKSYYHD